MIKATTSMFKFIAIVQARKEGKCTLLIINMSANPKILHCNGFGSKKKRFEVTADSLTSKKSVSLASNPNSKMARLNSATSQSFQSLT
ncbi:MULTISPECIES: hypothetical protein [unclassified Marinomonas]|jgi:hypothetical protein|uniref:hypothetical protein n=1 Tax=unclassified Marinomonas TaxID=196814 RepID=UPI002006DFD7|nr:hypothetical protein [Marinomonas sp. UCMA 3892]